MVSKNGLSAWLSDSPAFWNFSPFLIKAFSSSRYVCLVFQFFLRILTICHLNLHLFCWMLKVSNNDFIRSIRFMSVHERAVPNLFSLLKTLFFLWNLILIQYVDFVVMKLCGIQNINKFVILYYQQFQIRASHRLINLRDKVALFFLLKPNFGSQVAYTVYN